jgi:hypothetical protein
MILYLVFNTTNPSVVSNRQVFFVSASINSLACRNKKSLLQSRKDFVVGVAGFEPATFPPKSGT